MTTTIMTPEIDQCQAWEINSIIDDIAIGSYENKKYEIISNIRIVSPQNVSDYKFSKYKRYSDFKASICFANLGRSFSSIILNRLTLSMHDLTVN